MHIRLIVFYLYTCMINFNSSKKLPLNSIFKDLFNDISYVNIIKRFSLIYTMFEVSDGISFSQHLPLKSTINYFFNDI